MTGARPIVGPVTLEDPSRRWRVGATDEPDVPAVVVLDQVPRRGGRIDVVCHVTATRPGPLAVELPIHLPDAFVTSDAVMVPAILHPWEAAGSGLRPRLDPTHGIWLRADRLPQVGVTVLTPDGVWRIWSADDSPRPIRPGLVQAIGIRADPAGGLRVTWRYPQREAGHLADATRRAILGKRVVGIGEERFQWLDAGGSITLRLRMEQGVGEALADGVGDIARRIWSIRGRQAGRAVPLHAGITRTGIDARLDYLERRHWDPTIGQYASPDGSGSALAGFVEMSLGMAIASARLRGLGFGRAAPASLERDLDAIDRWVGADPILPVWDPAGATRGCRAYDRPGLPVTSAEVVEPIRVAVEARHLLALARQGTGGTRRSGRWRAAARATADWLLARRQDGVLPLVVGAMPAGSDPEATGDASAFLVGLLADLAFDEPDLPLRQASVAAAVAVYQAAVLPRIHTRRSGGVTIDAATPDREAAAAILESALALYEATHEVRYLDDARAAADAVLVWVMAYRCGTFQGGTDAADRAISTLGASIVSPENQHLDPFPIGGALVRYGLYAEDPIAARAGRANLAWCLDGRWATPTLDGLRQSEQLLHTRWHYDAWATERGDIRAGMPGDDGVAREHGWPQTLPLIALLEHGHVALDWPTGHVSVLPGLSATARRQDDAVRLVLDGPLAAGPLLVRVLRVPRGSLVVETADRRQRLGWPRSSVAFVVAASTVDIQATSAG